MNQIHDAIYNIHEMDTLANRNQWMNRIHPLVKFVLTLFYIAVVVSFSKYDLPGLLAMGIYPLAGFLLAELSFTRCISRLRIVLPLVMMVGLANPFFDTVPVAVGGMVIRAGVISMLTLMLKGIYAVLAAYLLIATTTIEKLCYALQLLHLPGIMITQIMLTYRYITLLLGEVNRITQAYSLRAPGQKGIHFKVWGTLTGQLLLRSIDRANTVYESMLLRGYDSNYSYVREQCSLKKSDLIYLLFWLLLLIVLRRFPVILLLGYVVVSLPFL